MWADVVAPVPSTQLGPGPAMSPTLPTGMDCSQAAWGAHYGAERLGCTVVPVSGGATEKQVHLINDFKPRVILVTPSYCLNLIDEMERQGLDPAACSLEVGVFGAEPWTDSMRAEIETRLGIDAVDIYGLSEVIGPGVSQECVETKDGPTVWEDHFYPEIIDPETGEVLPDGEEGELVFTSLTKQACPVIRYRTRGPHTTATWHRPHYATGWPESQAGLMTCSSSEASTCSRPKSKTSSSRCPAFRRTIRSSFQPTATWPV